MKQLSRIQMIFAGTLAAGAATADVPIEVQTFWTSPGEQRAFAELVRHIQDAGFEVEPVLIEGFTKLREQTSNRLAVDVPPELSHWVGGADQEVLSNFGKLLPVPGMIDGEAIEDVLYDEVLQEITIDGTRYGIPVGIHIQNSVLFNKKLLLRIGLDEFPKTWEGIFAMNQELEKAGIVPFAASSYFWIHQNLMDSILFSVSGEATINDLIGSEFDQSGTLEEVLESAFEVFLALRDVADDDHADRYWADMVDMVIQDKAAYTVIGDFAWSEIAVKAADRTADFACTALPDTDIAFFGVDSFVGFDTGNEAWSQGFPRLFEEIVSAEAQVDYLTYKGGLPVSQGVTMEVLNPCSATSLHLWQTAKGGRLPPYKLRHTTFSNVYTQAIRQVWDDPSFSPREAAQLLYQRIEALGDYQQDE